MTNSKDKRAQAPKATYTRPEVTMFGSLRNLTAGSGGPMPGDAGLMMAA